MANYNEPPRTRPAQRLLSVDQRPLLQHNFNWVDELDHHHATPSVRLMVKNDWWWLSLHRYWWLSDISHNHHQPLLTTNQNSPMTTSSRRGRWPVGCWRKWRCAVVEEALRFPNASLCLVMAIDSVTVHDELITITIAWTSLIAITITQDRLRNSDDWMADDGNG